MVLISDLPSLWAAGQAVLLIIPQYPVGGSGVGMVVVLVSLIT